MYDKGYSVLQTIDSGYIVAGYTNSFGLGLTDVYLVKLNVNGESERCAKAKLRSPL